MKSTAILGISIVAAVVIIFGALVFFKPKEEVKLPIIVEQYYDFNCPHCQTFHVTWKQLKADFSDEGLVQFKDINNPILGSSSLQAAFAATAAADQGKGEEYTDLLMTNADMRSDADYEKFAKDLKLDVAKFKKDKESEELQQRVNTILEENRAKGVTSTPTIMVNGRKAVSSDYDALKKLIEEKIELGKQQQNANS
jgi:protein-disulfide isomerase